MTARNLNQLEQAGQHGHESGDHARGQAQLARMPELRPVRRPGCDIGPDGSRPRGNREMHDRWMERMTAGTEGERPDLTARVRWPIASSWSP